MIAFHTDLDNTLIYSYKHDIGPRKRNVELYQGREISYITEETYHLLQLVKNEMLIVQRPLGRWNNISALIWESDHFHMHWSATAVSFW